VVRDQASWFGLIVNAIVDRPRAAVVVTRMCGVM
jgi:hypothetical protein